jgi:2'-5' RNA ligase
VRWTDPATIHLTLRFLGEVPAERVPAVAQAVAAAAATGRPLSLLVQGAGAFPSSRRPRVVWLGVGGEVAALRALVADLEARLAAAGFAPGAGPRRATAIPNATAASNRTAPFTPHLTLGRARSPHGAPALAPALAAPPGPPLPWPTDALVLFESHLGPGGARHEALQRAPLGDQAR